MRKTTDAFLRNISPKPAVKKILPKAAKGSISDTESEYGFGERWGLGERRVSHAWSVF